MNKKNSSAFCIEIIYNNQQYSTVDDIANLLNISKKEFIEIIKLFNGNKKGHFKLKEDSNDCLNYILKKYSDRFIYLKLIEE
jgi:hypothetical protein